MKELKELPEGWKWKKLGDVCKTTSGGTPNRGNKEYYDGNIPWVKSGELDRGLIVDTEEKITDLAIKNSSAKVFPKGTLLIALYGATIGKLAFLGIDAATNQAICGIYKNNSLDSNYLYHYLFNKKQKLVNQGIGGAQPNISQTILKNLDVPLPPLSTQQSIISKIEELFSELDKGVENLKTAQQQLKVYRQAVLKWAFEGKLTNGINNDANDLSDEKDLGMVAEPSEVYQTAKSLNHGFNDLRDDHDLKTGVNKTLEKNQKNQANQTNQGADNGGLPKGWKWVTFKEVSIKIGDIDHKMPKQLAEGYPYVSTKDFTKDFKISFDNAKYISEEDYLNLSRKIRPERGDIIFPRYGTIGKNILIDFDKEFLVSYSCAIIKLDKKKVIDKYAYLYSLSPKITDEIRKYVVETTQANIGIASIKSFVFPLSSLEEQTKVVHEIEKRLSVADKMEESIQQSLLQAESLRQSILKKAFEGGLVK
jgi:type I restriction enzyme S subunit